MLREGEATDDKGVPLARAREGWGKRNTIYHPLSPKPPSEHEASTEQAS